MGFTIRWLIPGSMVLAAMLVSPAGGEAPSLRIIPDAWPRHPRLIGYEFHMKDHSDISTEGTGEPRLELLSPSKSRYRVVGVEVSNPGESEIDASLVSPETGKTKKHRIEVAPGTKARRFFVIKDRPGKKEIQFDLIASRRTTLATVTAPYPQKGRMGSRMEARLIALELNQEEKVRRRFRMHDVAIAVRDEKGNPVEDAQLTLIHKKTGWMERVETGAKGRWEGRLLAGDWTILARKVFPPPRIDPESTTIPPSRVLCLLATETIQKGTEAALAPEGTTRLIFENEEGVPIGVDRVWLTPMEFAGPLSYQDVSRRSRGSFLLELDRRVEQGGVEILGSPGVIYEIGAFRRPGILPGALHSKTVKNTGEVIRIVEDPKSSGMIRWDRKKAPPGTAEIRASISLPDAIRVEISIDVAGETLLRVPAGSVRTEASFSMESGEEIRFAPHRVDIVAGDELDLTPRLPLTLEPYLIHSDGLQVWLALRDPVGRVVQSLRGEGMVKAAHRGQLLFEEPISRLKYQYPAGMDDVDIGQVTVAATLRLGEKEMKWVAKAMPFQKFQAQSAEVVAPAALEGHAEPYLEISRRSLTGSRRVMGLPTGIRRMSNRFVVFLPPEVGGLGGGGTIQLDLSELIRFAARTDSLPGAYRHEFGHNLGFGHDPYMFMAPCGIDDELFGETGYRMVNGGTMRRVFDYLNRPLPDPATPWKPSRNVFAAIGLLYGPDVHKKMFDVRVGAEPVLKQAGLSVIERIAAQYSFAAGDLQNMAWIFRAFGWPVLDERIWRAWFTLKQQEFRKKGAIPKYIAGFQMRQWWIQGPIPLLLDRDPAKAPEPPPWRYLAWREDFVNLPAGPPERKSVGYRLFHRIESARRMDALLVCGSDVQLDLLLNGQALSRIRASPQMSQPRHDDYRLESWAQSVIPVTFQKGENLLEAVAVQPKGSKGFFLSIANYEGKTPRGLRLRTAGPEDPEGTKIRAEALDRRPPVHNPSFEDGGRRPGPWIKGPVEPRGSMKWTWDTESALKGARCLSLTANGSTRGALIQRIILEPGAEYILSGAMKSEDLSGKDCEAYICLFLQDPFGGHLARTEPMKAGTTRWLGFNTKFYPRKRRVAYIGCVIVGSGGTVWFDEVRLTRK